MSWFRPKLNIEICLVFHVFVYPIVSTSALLGQYILMLIQPPNSVSLYKDMKCILLFLLTGASLCFMFTASPVLVYTLKTRSMQQLKFYGIIFTITVIFNNIYFMLRDHERLQSEFPNSFWTFFTFLYIYVILNLSYGVSLFHFGEKLRVEKELPVPLRFFGIRIQKLLYPHLVVLMILLLRDVIMHVAIIQANIPKILHVLPIYVISVSLNFIMGISTCIILYVGILTRETKWFRRYRLTKILLITPLPPLWAVTTYIYYDLPPKTPDAWMTYMHIMFTSMFFTVELILIQLYLNILEAKNYFAGNRKVSFNTYEDIAEFIESQNVPKVDVRFDLEEYHHLGKGQFGQVLKGKVQQIHSYAKHDHNKSTKADVAVKFMKNEFTNQESMSIVISEIKTLHSVGNNHENLVKFYGVVKNNASLSGLGIVMEYCALGSLKSYLINTKPDVCTINKISPDIINTRPDNSERDVDLHQFPELVKQLRKVENWAVQVASAMDYLGALKIVHADLAARNVLLDEHECAKVTDFGMSLRLYNYQFYAKSNSPVFPWRSMAPEVLSDLQFSTKSDVYSYGVLLWEMYTFGDTPWAGLEWTSNFVGYLNAGNCLRKPLFCSRKMYTGIIRPCLAVDKTERPTFQIIQNRISDVTDNHNC